MVCLCVKTLFSCKMVVSGTAVVAIQAWVPGMNTLTQCQQFLRRSGVRVSAIGDGLFVPAAARLRLLVAGRAKLQPFDAQMTLFLTVNVCVCRRKGQQPFDTTSDKGEKIKP